MKKMFKFEASTTRNERNKGNNELIELLFAKLKKKIQKENKNE
jgi:hypothetical protein